VRKSQPYLDARGNPTELPPTHSNGQPLVEFEGGRRVYWRDERAQYTGGNFEVGSIVDAGDVGDGRQAIMTPNNVIHELGHSFNYFAGLGGNTGNIYAIASAQGQTSRDGMGYPDPSEFLGTDLYWQITSATGDGWWTDNPPEYLGDDIIAAGGRGYRTNNYVDVLQHNPSSNDVNEVVADAFLNWVVDLTTGNWVYQPQDGEIDYSLRGFTHDADGDAWRNFMNNSMNLWFAKCHNTQYGCRCPYCIVP
jgi:hypothetical protein